MCIKNGENESEAENRMAGPSAGPSGWGGQRWLAVGDCVTGCVLGLETKETHP